MGYIVNLYDNLRVALTADKADREIRLQSDKDERTAGDVSLKLEQKIQHQEELVAAYGRILDGTDEPLDFFLHTAYKAEYDVVSKAGKPVDTSKQLTESQLASNGFITLETLATTTHKDVVDTWKSNHIVFLDAEDAGKN